MWIIEVPGPRPLGGGNPPWARHGRFKPETPEGDVQHHLAELLGMHAAARATLGRLELIVTRRGSRRVRYL